MLPASPIVSSAEHRTAEGAEQGQDRSEDEQKNPAHNNTHKHAELRTISVHTQVPTKGTAVSG